MTMRGVSVLAVGESDVVDPNTPLAIVLLQGVCLVLEVGDDFVFGVNFCLEGNNFGIGFLEKFLQGVNFAGKRLQGLYLLSEGV